MVNLESIVPCHIVVRSRGSRCFAEMRSQRRIVMLFSFFLGKLDLWSQCLLPLTLPVDTCLIDPRSAISLVTLLPQFNSWHINLLLELINIGAGGVGIWCNVCVIVRFQIWGDL